MFKNFIKAFKDGYHGISGQDDPRSYIFPVRGFRDDDSIFGDDVELKKDKKNDWKVIHEDHTIGWITAPGFTSDDFEDNEILQIQRKDGKAVVVFLPMD